MTEQSWTTEENWLSKFARRWAIWLLAIPPLYVVLNSLSEVINTYQAVPYMDQWATVEHYRGVLANGLSLKGLWDQHNEHRILFPRLIFLADFKWLHGSNVLNLFAILATQIAAALLFVKLALADRRSVLTSAALAVGVMALFSLSQWDNFVWGFQVQFVGVYCCGAWAIYVYCLSVRDPARIDWRSWAIAMALLAVCTFSMANGVLVGAAMLALAVAARLPLRVFAATLAVTIGLAAAYFHGYHVVAGHSPPALVLQHPVRYLFYVMAYLGNWFGQETPWPAVRLGLIGVALTLGMAVQVIFRRERDTTQLALFAIVLFIGVSAAVTGLGRLSFGIEQALSGRYVTPSAFFWTAQLLFWSRSAVASQKIGLQVCVGAILMTAALVVLDQQAPQKTIVEAWRDRVALGSNAILTNVNDAEAIRALYPDPTLPPALSPFLKEQGLSIFAAPEAHWMGRRLHEVFALAPADACHGSLDDINLAPGVEATWRGRGWAWDRKARKPVRRVVLTNVAGEIVGLGTGGGPRSDVPAAIKAVNSANVGWMAVLKPPGSTPISAYAILADGRACAIGSRTVAP